MIMAGVFKMQYPRFCLYSMILFFTSYFGWFFFVNTVLIKQYTGLESIINCSLVPICFILLRAAVGWGMSLAITVFLLPALISVKIGAPIDRIADRALLDYLGDIPFAVATLFWTPGFIGLISFHYFRRRHFARE